jgi:putative FmdB family regulatory protein
MPIYEYRCPNGHTFELLQRMSDAPPEVCEICGAAPVEKVLYPAAIHFKGSGFYSTDYGRGGRKKAKESDGASSSDSSSSDSSSDSKPAVQKTDKPATDKKPAGN